MISLNKKISYTQKQGSSCNQRSKQSNNKVLSSLLILAIALFITSCGKAIIINEAILTDPVYPMFGRVPQRSFNVDSALGDSLVLKWDTDVNGGFANTSIVCMKSCIFVPDLSGRVYAIKISNGKEIGYVSNKGTVAASPIINQFKFIYVLAQIKDNQSTLFNYDFKQGKVETKQEVKGRVLSELLKLPESFIFCTEDGRVYSYSYNFRQQWEFDAESFLHSSPVFAANSIIFGNDKGEVFCINAQSGTEKYRIKMGSGFEGGFASSGDSVFTADNNGTFYCFNASDGKVFWKFNSGARVTNFPVINNEFIYFGNLRGDIYKIKRSGEQVWMIPTGSVINTTPLLFTDILVQPDYNKKVYLIDIISGKILKTMFFDDRVKLSPVFYNDILFIGTDNDLYAYEKFHQ